MRISLVLLAFGISLSAVPSQAQTTTTNCSRVGTQLYCTSNTPQAPSGPYDYTTPLLRAQELQQQQAQQWQQVQSNIVQMAIARRQQQLQEQQAQAQQQALAEQQGRAELQAQAEREAREADKNLRLNLGAMISQGNCAGAKDLALKEGRLDLVPLVSQDCAVPAPTPAK